MESNKDEALRSFGIAEKYFLADNLVSARKFCLKSISLFKTTQAESLLVKIDAAESSSSSPSSSSTSPSSSDAPKASATEEHPSAAGMKHRHNTAAPQAASSTTANGSSKKRDYTPQQHEVVKRVRACKVTEFYEILALQKDCEEADVKRAYRKVCVLFLGFVLFLLIWVMLIFGFTLFFLLLVGARAASRQEWSSWCR